jgi:hypothetical protein
MALLISKRPFGASFSVSSLPFNLANRPSNNLAYDRFLTMLKSMI